MSRGRPQLLISVRSVDEAQIALEAGADLIDVKEPARGALGVAEPEIVTAVLELVACRVPVSAALGEWSPTATVDAHWHLELPLQYIKWGLAGYPDVPGWGDDLLTLRRSIPSRTEVVLVAYADSKKAKAIAPLELAKFAKRYRYKTFLLDTFLKDGKTLLDHRTPAEVQEIVETARAGGAKVALGGGLRLEQLKLLKDVAPDWFAVRGAVCAGGDRSGMLDATRVKKWKDALAA